MTTLTAEKTAKSVKPYFLNIDLILSFRDIRPSIFSFSLSISSICSCCSLILWSMFSSLSGVAVFLFSFSSLNLFSRLVISSLLASTISSAVLPRALIIVFGSFSLTSPSELNRYDIMIEMILSSVSN